MKTYKTFILEASEFVKKLRSSEKRYPGVYMFMTVAAKYLMYPDRLKDGDASRLLKRLRLKSDVSDFSNNDMARTYAFMQSKGLATIEDVRAYFISITDPTGEAGPQEEVKTAE